MIPALLASGFNQAIVTNAFQPVIDLMQGIAYPLCFLMVSGSFLLIMLGQRAKGINMLKWAAIGYIGLQFAPTIMMLIVEVATAMRSGMQP